MQIRTDPFQDAYEVYEDLGSGQFAVVRRCKDRTTNVEYAAKFVIKRRPNSNSRKGLFREKILQEIEILSELNHNNIIKLYQVFETNQEMILVLELVKGGELFEYISEKDHLSESDAAKFITQILEGVAHFHAKNIVHLDLKPENVMLLDRQNCLIKIIDFGISRKLRPGEKVMETYGTPEFVAPEIIQYQPISTATDMWSIGVITYILLSGASPFLGDSKQETFANITNIDYSFDDEYFGHTSDLAKDFISRLFVKDVRKRATVTDCLEHPWIKPRRTQDEELRRQAQINIEQFKSFIARRRWKQSVLAVSLCNKIIRKSQYRLSSTLSLDNINCVSFGKNLLDNGDDFVLTALLCAAEDGNFTNLKNLLQIAQIDVNRSNKNKETALHIAASNGNLEIIKMLKEHNIDFNARDINGENAIHYCCRCINIEAAKNTIEYLVKNGVSLDVQNKDGETPLHVASRYKCFEWVKILCEYGANMDIQDDQLETPLHVACWNAFPEIVKCLCVYGCDANLKNKEGETALIVACARGCIESVRTLIQHKADLNCRDNRKNTALHWSVRRHYTQIALLLIQAECNMDSLDANGESALHIACRENLILVVQTMCALGCRVDIKNKKEMTPLHTATEKNEIDAVRCLCLAGPDLNIINKDGLTAEQLATDLKYVHIANLLSSVRRDQNREMFIEQLIPTNDYLRRIKIKVFGSSGVGKSSLISSMNCSYINSFFRRLSSKTTIKSQRNYGLKRNDLEKIANASSFDMPSGSDSFDSDKNSHMNINILDKYDVSNVNYTKGIEITQSTFNGSHHFSIWEFSGYEPYKIFYDHFIGDANCIHMVIYNLNQSQQACFDECVQWLEYLRARISNRPASSTEQDHHTTDNNNNTSTNPSLSNSMTQSTMGLSTLSTATTTPTGPPPPPPDPVKIIFVATYADMDRTCVKKDDGRYASDKARNVQHQLENFYANDGVFDLTEQHFVLDSRAAWVNDIKQLIEHLIRLKQSIVERLPKCTMFLNRTLISIQNWRKIMQTNNFQQPAGPMFNPLSPLSASMSQTSLNTVPFTPATPSTPINVAFKFSNLVNFNYPIMRWKQFIEQIRDVINPLANDVHFYELVQQLQLMGEIVFIESDYENDMVCFQPEWLTNKILGRLFSYDRYFNVKPNNLNGIYKLSELREIFADVCTDVNLLKDIFISYKLCAELEDVDYYLNGDLIYEFSALNFLSEPLPLAFRTIKNFANNNNNNHNNSNQSPVRTIDSGYKPTVFIVNGFQIRTSMYHNNNSNKLANGSSNVMNNSMTSSTFSLFANKANGGADMGCGNVSSQLASLFFLIQVSLRYLTSNYYSDLDTSNLSKSSSTHKQSKLAPSPSGGSGNQPLKLQPPPVATKLQRPHFVKSNSKLDTLLEDTSPAQMSSNPSSYPNTANSTMNILQSPSLTSSKLHQNMIDQSSRLLNLNLSQKLNGALIDIDLYQTRYCSRLTRKPCFIECLLSLDHVNGEYIELRACAPELWREELFYFVQDLYSVVEHIILDACPNLNLERHFMSFKPVKVPSVDSNAPNGGIMSLTNLGVISHDAIYTQRDVIQMQLENSLGKCDSSKLVDLVFCGSENIERNAIYGIDLDFGRLDDYARTMICTYLDRTDPMGRDWSIMAFLLGLQDVLPKMEEHTDRLTSKCEWLLNEWYRQKPDQATIRNLLAKINDLGRKDVYEMALNTISLYRIKMSKDSGIQNSNQTLASLK